MKTLQELADFLGMIVAVTEDRSTYAYEAEPTMRPYGDDWLDDGDWYSKGFEYCIPKWMVNYHGSWEDSLTFPNIVEGIQEGKFVNIEAEE